MQINISGHHLDLTPAIREYCESKLHKVFQHFDKITSAQVTLSVEKLIQKAEVIVHINGQEIYAGSEDKDLYAAIDSLVDKLDRQLKKHKEKLQNHR